MALDILYKKYLKYCQNIRRCEPVEKASFIHLLANDKEGTVESVLFFCAQLYNGGK